MKNILIALAMLVALTGCKQIDQQDSHTKNQQAAIAQRTADSIRFTENAEIENIKKRLELTSNPGLLGYIILLNQTGQPVMYSGVKGKVTSSAKRLTSPELKVDGWNCGSGLYCDHMIVSPSDEGTYGSSDPYIYFWTPSGQYVQWNGGYLYSDQPFRLKVSPIVIQEVEARAEAAKADGSLKVTEPAKP